MSTPPSSLLQVARGTLAVLLLDQESHLWRFRNGDEPTPHTQQQAVRMASTSMTIMGLLKEHPSLARSRFPFPPGLNRTRALYYPLAFFLLNSFGAQILDQVYDLYPQAMSDQAGGGPSVWEYATSCFRIGDSEETLLWMLSHIQGAEETMLNNGAIVTLVVLLTRMMRDGTGTRRLSPELVKAFLVKMSPIDHTSFESLLELVVGSGYDRNVLDVAIGMQFSDGDSIKLSGTWQFHQDMALVMEHRLPQLRQLGLHQSGWTVDGWTKMLSVVPTCASLKSLELTVAYSWLLDNPASIPVFKYFLTCKPSTMKLELKLEGHQTLGNEVIQSEYRRFFPMFSKVLHEAVEHPLAKKLSLNPSNTSSQTWAPVIDRLHLQRFFNLPIDLLTQLVVDAVGLIVLYVCTTDFAGETADDGLVATSTSEFGLAQEACLGTRQALKLVSGFAALEDAQIFLKYSMRNQMQLLQQLTLDLDGAPPGHADITRQVISFLKCPSLLGLYIKCSPEEEEGKERHSLQIAQVCDALKGNYKLRRLEFEDLVIEHERFEAVPSLLLEVVEEKQTSLEILTITDGRRAYTVIEGYLTGFEHADYETEWKTQFFLWLNECGRGELTDNSMQYTLEDLVLLLDELQNPHDRMLDCVRSALRALLPRTTAAIPHQQVHPAHQLTETFRRIRGTVPEWCNAPFHQFKTYPLAGLYTVLRECPDLWCNSDAKTKWEDTTDAALLFGSRKRKRESQGVNSKL